MRDEKDDKIQEQSGLVEMLKQRLHQMRDEKDDKILEQSGLGEVLEQEELSSATMKEVLQALEELAVNYDQKFQKAETM